jgi:uncharacterized protein involved in exopolysaccharide biosynthesis
VTDAERHDERARLLAELGALARQAQRVEEDLANALDLADRLTDILRDVQHKQTRVATALRALEGEE